MKKYFVTAISTDSGKTIVSAILVNALQADYWKPVQSGAQERDAETIASLLTSGHSIIHPEAYLLETPVSPHAAAAKDGIRIDLNNIEIPDTDGNDLIIEGAGGILVPLNENDSVIDLIQKLEAEVILVSNHYLGSINHTLLSAAELKRRQIPVKGIIFNGTPNPESEAIILKRTGYTCLLKLLKEPVINAGVIQQYSLKLFENWHD